MSPGRPGARIGLALALAAALGGCAPSYRYDLSPGRTVSVERSPLLQRELLEAARQAVGALALDALEGEDVLLSVAAPAGNAAAGTVRAIVRAELERRGARLASPGEADGNLPRLDILVEEWGADLARSGLVRTRQMLTVRAVARSTLGIPGLEPLEDRAEASRRIDYAAGWFGCDCLLIPAPDP